MRGRAEQGGRGAGLTEPVDSVGVEVPMASEAARRTQDVTVGVTRVVGLVLPGVQSVARWWKAIICFELARRFKYAEPNTPSVGSLQTTGCALPVLYDETSK